MDLPDELNINELLKFHQSLRKLTSPENALIAELQLEPTKEIRNYSSGMKQRLKLALAFYSESSVVLLDEPTATLDEHWTQWYLKKVQEISSDKLVIISSNIPAEYSFCEVVVKL